VRLTTSGSVAQPCRQPLTSGRGCSGGVCADSARCRNGGVRADSAQCAPVPSPSDGAVVAMALTRGAMIASKAKAKHSFGPKRFRVEQTAKTSDASLSSTSAMSKHCTHCKGTPSKSAILSTGSPGVSWFAVASGRDGRCELERPCDGRQMTRHGAKPPRPGDLYR
jgi:hypothetical protein